MTAARLKQAFPNLIEGTVERYALDHLHGLNFVMRRALEGGVNRSLNLDSHGKSWSSLVLSLEVAVRSPLTPPAPRSARDGMPRSGGR